MCFIIVIWGRKTMRNQQLQTDYTEDMVDYWKERSHTYSKDNRSQLENEKKTVWENLILSNTTQEKQLNILDVGTGPGFFAVLLAQKGHHVTAVDVSADMLERAKENLNYYQVHADLRLLDGNDLPFSDDTFGDFTRCNMDASTTGGDTFGMETCSKAGRTNFVF